MTFSHWYEDSGHCKKVCIPNNTYAHLRALNSYCKQSIFVWNCNKKWVNEKTLKKKNELLLWVWQKQELQITKIPQDTKQPRYTIATILTTFQLRKIFQIAKRWEGLHRKPTDNYRDWWKRTEKQQKEI